MAQLLITPGEGPQVFEDNTIVTSYFPALLPPFDQVTLQSLKNITAKAAWPGQASPTSQALNFNRSVRSGHFFWLTFVLNNRQNYGVIFATMHSNILHFHRNVWIYYYARKRNNYKLLRICVQLQREVAKFPLHQLGPFLLHFCSSHSDNCYALNCILLLFLVKAWR